MKTAALLILFLILGMDAGALLFTAINPSYELGLALAALLTTAAAGVVLVTLWQLKGMFSPVTCSNGETLTRYNGLISKRGQYRH